MTAITLSTSFFRFCSIIESMQIAVVLHNIRSVHNVGSIFRTADGAGVHKIYLCGITPAPFDRLKNVRKDFAKVALGAESYIPWESAKSTGSIVKRLKREGYSIFALEQSKRSISYSAVRIKDDARIAIVLGSEVRGLPPSLLALANQTLEIPMHGKKESLNVAVAFGIAVFGLRATHDKL